MYKNRVCRWKRKHFKCLNSFDIEFIVYDNVLQVYAQVIFSESRSMATEFNQTKFTINLINIPE